VANRVRLAGVGGPFELGGRPRANRRAHDDAWPQAVTFLTNALAAERTN
jgi:hypothetical protein